MMESWRGQRRRMLMHPRSLGEASEAAVLECGGVPRYWTAGFSDAQRQVPLQVDAAPRVDCLHALAHGAAQHLERLLARAVSRVGGFDS